MVSLYIRNIIFFILQPGVVVGLVPYFLAQDELKSAFKDDFNILSYTGIFLFVLGIIVVIYCIYRFIIDGKGTLSPVDQTKALVITGLYKYSRNPMYVGVLLALLGEAIFAMSSVLFVYTILVFLTFHLFVIFVEEPRLRKDFKEQYKTYTSLVRRWL